METKDPRRTKHSGQNCKVLGVKSQLKQSRESQKLFVSALIKQKFKRVGDERRASPWETLWRCSPLYSVLFSACVWKDYGRFHSVGIPLPLFVGIITA